MLTRYSRRRVIWTWQVPDIYISRVSRVSIYAGAGYAWIVTEQALHSRHVPHGALGLHLTSSTHEEAHIHDSLWVPPPHPDHRDHANCKHQKTCLDLHPLKRATKERIPIQSCVYNWKCSECFQCPPDASRHSSAKSKIRISCSTICLIFAHSLFSHIFSNFFKVSENVFWQENPRSLEYWQQGLLWQ